MSLVNSVDLDAVRLGPVSGFYPVPGIEDPENQQLWVPKTLQEFEARCLANDIYDDGFYPDIIFGIARGGMMVAQEIAYNNNVKRVSAVQTIGYGENNEPLETPLLVGKPDISAMPKGMKILLADELIDNGGALLLVSAWITVNLRPSDLRAAVIYEKEKQHLYTPYYVGRKVPDVWLDHESQADRQRLAVRFAQLRNTRGHLMRAMGFLSTEPPRRDTLNTLLAAS